MVQTVNGTAELKALVQSVFHPILESWDGSPIVILLSGDLGAGKTTVTQFLAEMFHVKHLVKSPTFIYVDEHKFDYGNSVGTLYHWDLWRLRQEDFSLLKMEDKILPHTVHAIEWWERSKSDISTLLESKKTVVISINLASSAADENRRVVEWQIS